MEETRTNNEPLTKISERFQSALAEGREESQEAWEKFQDRRKEAVEDARKLIQKYPGTAVGLAMLVGAAIGVLATFRRKRD